MESVSIVLNNYNYARYLRAAVDSALAQTHSDCEVIVVDDGSTDESIETLKSYGDQIRLIEQANGGQASAFNAGVVAAKGNYILLLDADDVLLVDAVATALGAFGLATSRVAWQLEYIDGDGQPLPDAEQKPLYPGFDGDAIQAYMEQDTFPVVPTSGNLFRTEALKAVLPMPEAEFRISADSYIFVKTSELGPIHVLSETLSQYRIHGSNNYQSCGDFFDPRILQKHLEAAFATSGLLEAAARKRDPEWVDRRIETRLSNCLKVILARRYGLMPQTLTAWPFLKLFKGFWKHARLSFPKRLVGLAAMLAFRVLPIRLLRVLRR